jgi:pimeloyl-ACP methyl ester carboxylesterase
MSRAELYIDDVQAVIDGMSPRRFALVGSRFGAPEAIAIAARNPDRVSHLVLAAPVLRVRD